MESVILTASIVIQEDGNTRNATKALHVLEAKIDRLREAVTDERRRKHPQEDFTFTYEEEADPEIFFVPYVWDVIVCAVTASSIEWDRSQIRVFPLLEDDYHGEDIYPDESETGHDPDSTGASKFAVDVVDIV